MSEKLSVLRAKRAKLIEDARTYAESPEFDAGKFAERKAEIEAIGKQIEATEEMQALQAKHAIPVPGQQLAVPARKLYRSGSLRNFRGDGAIERAHRFGQFALATLGGSPKAAAWCREQGIEIRAASEGVNSAGGWIVPDEFSTDIIDLRDDYGMFRRLCTVFPMGRDAMNVPRRTGGLTAYAVGEGVAPSQSQMGWDQVKLTADKWAVLTLMSSELDEDAAVSIGDILLGEIAYAFAIAEDTAGFSGDGTSTYHGIRGFLQQMGADQITAGASTLAGCLDAASGHDTFAEIDATDLGNLMAKLPQYVYMRGRPAFYVSQAGWAACFQRIIMNSGGISKDDATGRVIYQYLGFPVEISPAMPVSTGDLSDKVMVMFGDIGLAAAFGDRRGLTIARSTEYKFAEDQIAIKGTERFAINIHDIGNTTTAGPVVALIGE